MDIDREKRVLISCGSNQYGQLGDSSRSLDCDASVPVSLNFVPMGDITQISCGGSHVLLLMNFHDGLLSGVKRSEAFGWGSNRYGQLGPCLPLSDIQTIASLESLVPNNTFVTHVSAGHAHSILVLSDGRALTLGDNTHGQCGIQVQPESNFINISSVPCGKSKNADQIDSFGSTLNLIQVHGMSIVSGACGVRHSLLGLNDGRGIFLSKQICTVFALPQIDSCERVREIKQISCGFSHGVLLDDHTSVWKVAYNKREKKVEMTIVEVPLERNEEVVQLSCGWRHAAVRTGFGRVFVWGNNAFGQLGVSDLELQNVHVPIRFTLAGICADHVECGSEFTAIIANGKTELYACGWNEHGNLGIGENLPSLSDPRPLYSTETVAHANNSLTVVHRVPLIVESGYSVREIRQISCGGAHWIAELVVAAYNRNFETQ